ncbi:MAG: hypothetical protein K2P88_17000 [Chitinophagaceae bacterium]|uniref:hypothetical protein n=1 Tax=unclassified Paraflavitalea TaxID=2798305 RepID=UPI003D349148|nr:hypothetical protein [Chitinophagaceae bacterium]
MRIAAVTILYNPPNDFIANILTYKDHIEKLYLIDNSPNPLLLDLGALSEKAVYYWDGYNKGIAQRLNEACSKAIKDGYSFLLTMDQDSSFNESQISGYLRSVEIKMKSGAYSMIGIRYYQLKQQITKDEIENSILITSGSVVNLDAFKKIGEFDESFFIDEVDTEYCIRSLKIGYRTALLNMFFLNHSEGIKKKISIFGIIKMTRMIHSPIRMYYKVRNIRKVRKKHPEFKHLVPLRYIFNVIKNNLVYSNFRIKSFFYILKGLFEKI